MVGCEHRSALARSLILVGPSSSSLPSNRIAAWGNALTSRLAIRVNRADATTTSIPS